MWWKQWSAERNSRSAHHNILQELRVQHAENYRKYLRMNVETFEFLLVIRKQTNVRRAPPEEQLATPGAWGGGGGGYGGEQLAITLCYFATGESSYSIMCQHRVSDTTIGRSVPHVCWGIIVTLVDEYMSFPETPQE